jgi:ATP-dependent DNA ligase
MLMRSPTRFVRPKRLQPRGLSSPVSRRSLASAERRRLDSRVETRRLGILAFKDGDTVRLWSRNGRAIKEAMHALPFKRVILDGEAVAHCLDGLPDFHRLLGHGQATACLYAFDLLWLEAQDVRGLELIGRRRLLQKALKKAGPVLRFSEHLSAAEGEAMFRHACAMGLSKRLTSRYKSGACRSWLKVKNPAYERRSQNRGIRTADTVLA